MPINFNLVPYFKQEDFDDPLFPGSGKHINGQLLHQLVKLRIETGWPIITHASVGGCVDMQGDHGHDTYSYHLLNIGACAVDFHFLTNKSLRIQYNWVCRYGFTGIGVYLDLWKWNNTILPIGFHVDLRPIHRTQHWSCRKKGEYLYLL